jgi:cytoskeleton protein RodZ
LTDGFGTKLKRAREASGVALRDIAISTKISVAALEALERNDYSRLPGGIFSRAFIRGYATAVGLDPESTVQEYLAEVSRSESEAARVATEHPEVTAEDRAFLERQKRAIFLLQIAGVLLVIALGAGGAFAWMRWTRSTSEPGVASDQAVQVSPPARPAPAPPPQAAPPPVETRPAPATPPPPAPKPDAQTATPPVKVVPPEPPPPVPVTPEQQDPLTLEFEVTSPSFVEVAADGKVSFSKAMEPGDRQRIQALKELRIKVGDAGAFVWSLNGKPARALGEAGIARSARVTRSNFKRFLQ